MQILSYLYKIYVYNTILSRAAGSGDECLKSYGPASIAWIGLWHGKCYDI